MDKRNERNNFWDELNFQVSEMEDTFEGEAKEVNERVESENSCANEPAGLKSLSGTTSDGKSDDDRNEDEEPEVIDIYLGLVIPPDEYTDENIKVVKENLLSKRSVKFCSEQFNDKQVSYNIVNLEVMPEAVTALLDEAIDENGELNKKVHPNSISIVLDIGGGTTDMAAIQGLDIIPASEKQVSLGVNDALLDIAQEIEKVYGVGYIETNAIANVVRFPLGVCDQCQAVAQEGKQCTCGGNFEMRKNMIRLGQKVFDVSDIVNVVFNEKADALADFFKRYLDTLFKARGINRNQLDTVLIVGGGGELLGKILKDKITSFVGEYVEIKKANRAVWKTLNGLSKYIVLKNKRGKRNFKRFVFIDAGNFATKAKLVDVNGKEMGKPIELMTKTSTPIKLGTISLRKVHPMMDLNLEISSDDGAVHPGDGHYFVSHLANKGKNLKNRNAQTPKIMDELTYIMINSAIGVLLGRDKAND